MTRFRCLQLVPLSVLALLGVLALPSPARAQYMGHNFHGDFGVNSGSQPGPGFYFALPFGQWNMDQIKDADGNKFLPSLFQGLDVRAIPPTAVVVTKKSCSAPTTGSWWRCRSRPSGPSAPLAGGPAWLGIARPVRRAAATRLAHEAGRLRRRLRILCSHRRIRGGRRRERRTGHVVARDPVRHHRLSRLRKEVQRRHHRLLRDALEQEGPGSEGRQPADARGRLRLQRAQDRRRVRHRLLPAEQAVATTPAAISHAGAPRHSTCTATTSCSASAPT